MILLDSKRGGSLNSSKNINLRAFSMIELSIVLVILAVITGGGLSLFNQYSTASKIEQTKDRMKVVLQAIDDYYDAYYNVTDTYNYARIPGPADRSQSFSVTNDNTISTGNLGNAAAFGISSGRSGSPYFQCNSGNRVGFVPTYTLRIPPEYAFDAWGNRLMYICNVGATGVSQYKNPGNTQLSNANTTHVVVLISSGPNQKGAFFGRNGEQRSGVSPSGDENENLSFSAFRDSAPYSGYDDIMMSITLQQIKAGDVTNPYFENK